MSDRLPQTGKIELSGRVVRVGAYTNLYIQAPGTTIRLTTANRGMFTELCVEDGRAKPLYDEDGLFVGLTITASARQQRDEGGGA